MKFAFSVVMAVSILSTAVGALAADASLHESPGRRECRIHEGVDWDVHIGSDQVSFCRFGGFGIDDNSYAQHNLARSSTLAVMAFLQDSNPSGDPASACQAAGGSVVDTSDLDGNDAVLCRFSDGSMIEATALAEGPAGATLLKAALSQ